MNQAFTFFMTITNPRQSDILMIGTSDRCATVDPESKWSITFDNIISITVSVDFLIADGAIGVKWIKTFKRVPEPPLELLL